MLKTARATAGSDRLVVLVAGPPCAGKSTFVNNACRAGDTVVDYDAIARDLGSQELWDHPRRFADAADRRMDDMMAEVAAMESGRAWVIRCAPDPGDRLGLASRIRATRTLVLLPPLPLLMRRAKERPGTRRTCAAIWRWMDDYSPEIGDELVSAVGHR